MAGRAGDGTPTTDTALEVVDVVKRFRNGRREVDALKGVSLHARSGGVTGLIGPDGAGKTTLMRLVAGLLAPDAGSIRVLGVDVVDDALRVQATLGYMPQRFGLYEDLSVRENLDLYADLRGVAPSARPERYRELMQMTGLGGFDSRLAGRLSGGMKQKLGLACTLIRAPELLLLDEPTVGVDPVSRRELWAIVYRLTEAARMSVLLSTAYLDEAERCDEVVVLDEGRVLVAGPPGDLAARARGRTFFVEAGGVGKRELQAALYGQRGIVDALILGERVRIVTDEASPPDLSPLLPGVPEVRADPVPPRFEDSFVLMLHGSRGATKPRAETHVAPPPGARSTRDPSEKPAQENVIEVHDVKRRFGTFYAVDGVSFDVRRGEIFALLGANGAGKSTTFRMLCGLLPASAGTLRVAGVDLRHAASAARARIGYMSQRFSLYGDLSVEENLDFFSRVYGLSGARRDDRLRWAVREFDLAAFSDTQSAELPLGYKQRLAMACALMHEPEILFLDEPTSGVDPLARRAFWRRIDALARSGVTVLVTTHFMEEAEYCDRVAIMAAGRILAIGTPAEIRADARSTQASEPTMEDAFIRLVTRADGAAATP
ncbi:MAG: ATP-binding cassette domain-containing protein [Rudaea sp.]